MNILSHDVEDATYPAGMKRLEYQSAVDGVRDWALLWPGQRAATWIVNLHGHGGQGDQLYQRQDIREAWLPFFQKSGAGILSVNLRGNAWMSPAAAADLHALLQWMRAEHHLQRTLFWSGSMGGTGNLIYASLHPEDVDGVVALGAATDLPAYHNWCREHQHKKAILGEIATAIEIAYAAESGDLVERLKAHSAVRNAERLTMPIYLVHGAADEVIPVEEARRFAALKCEQKYFYYNEIPGGNHDAPLWDLAAIEFATLVMAEWPL